MKKRKNKTTKFSLALLLVAVVALCLMPYEAKALSSQEICTDPNLCVSNFRTPDIWAINR